MKTKTKTTTTKKTTTTTKTTTKTKTTTTTKTTTATDVGDIPEAIVNTLKYGECIETALKSDEIVNDSEKVPPIDLFINPSKEEALNDVVNAIQNISKNYFSNSDMAKLYPNLFKILWYASLPCYDSHDGLSENHLIKSCQIAGKDVECSHLFTKIPTDLGMCCALNYEEALISSEYVDLVADMQNTDDKVNKITDKMKIPALIGKRNGLKLTVDLNTNSESLGTVSDDFSAFKIFIGNPEEFSVMEEKAILLEPGMEHFLSLASQVYEAEGIEGMDPNKRKCYFPNEGQLNFYKKYTFLNCKFECGIELLEKLLGCIPWYLPQGANNTACDPWTARIFSSMLGDVQSNTTNCKDCLPDCTTKETTVTLSSAKFR